MMRIVTRVAAGTLALLATVTMTGFAEDWVVKTACDSVLVGGVPYSEVTFDVRNVYPHPDYPIFDVLAIPVSFSGPDSCRAISAGAPDAWVPYIEPENGHILWSLVDENSTIIFPGQALGGFRLVLSREHSCCLDFYFAGVFPEPLGTQRVCFECVIPVPTIRRTWGAVKLLYR